MKCKNCRYYIKAGFAPAAGFCYFNPPVNVLIMNDVGPVISGTRPQVKENDFCNFFKAVL